MIETIGHLGANLTDDCEPFETSNAAAASPRTIDAKTWRGLREAEGARR